MQCIMGENIEVYSAEIYNSFISFSKKGVYN